MPYLQFTRDKRGYENTFVLHAGRSRGRKHARVLYWFRTPPGVRVGRSALDEEAIRTIEALNPDIHFDWTEILQNRTESEPPAPHKGPASSPRGEKRRDTRPPAAPPASVPVNRVAAEPPARDEPQRGLDVSDEGRESSHEDQGPAPLEAADADDILVDDSGADGDDDADEAKPLPMLERLSALEDLVGSEGVARLRARFSELRARIAEQPEPDALRAEAEGLNPDTWVTTEEARLGLEGFEAGFETIRRKLPAPRRRRRGRQSNAPDAGSADADG